MKEWDEQGYLLVTTTKKLDDFSEGKDKEGNDLLSHSYTILKVVEGDEAKLLQIRDSWQTFEWEGQWTHGADAWDEEADLMKEHDVGKKYDGTFWVSAEEFYMNFDGVIVTKV